MSELLLDAACKKIAQVPSKLEGVWTARPWYIHVFKFLKGHTLGNFIQNFLSKPGKNLNSRVNSTSFIHQVLIITEHGNAKSMPRVLEGMFAMMSLVLFVAGALLDIAILSL